MLKILIVDDHPISRGGIAALLATESDFTVCAEAGSAGEAMIQVEKHAPDLALIDINLPDRSGLELIKDLKAMNPSMLLIAISMHDEDMYAERVLRAGAQGYISKQIGASEIVDAIKSAVQSGLYVSDRMATKILKGVINQTGQNDPLSVLTDRELEVFQHIGEGRNTRAIAERLSVSPRTIEAHRTNIKEKLQLEDMTALLRYALQWAERSR